MSKRFLKNVTKRILLVSLILEIGCSAFAMHWDDLDVEDQHRILKTHIINVTPPAITLTLNGDRPNRAFLDPTEYRKWLSQRVHTGGWLENYPNINIEEDCPTCKQEINLAYQTKVAFERRVAQEVARQLALKPPSRILFVTLHTETNTILSS